SKPGRAEEFVAAAAETVARHLDLDHMLAIARESTELQSSSPLPCTRGGGEKAHRSHRSDRSCTSYKTAPPNTGARGEEDVPIPRAQGRGERMVRRRQWNHGSEETDPGGTQ